MRMIVNSIKYKPKHTSRNASGGVVLRYHALARAGGLTVAKETA